MSGQKIRNSALIQVLTLRETPARCQNFRKLATSVSEVLNDWWTKNRHSLSFDRNKDTSFGRRADENKSRLNPGGTHSLLPPKVHHEDTLVSEGSSAGVTHTTTSALLGS